MQRFRRERFVNEKGNLSVFPLLCIRVFRNGKPIQLPTDAIFAAFVREVVRLETGKGFTVRHSLSDNYELKDGNRVYRLFASDVVLMHYARN